MSIALFVLAAGALGSMATVRGAAGREGANDVGFVRVRGNQLVVGDDGAPFRFAGANLAVMHGPDSRAGAAALLDEAARDGLRVGRIWAFGEGAADAAPWQKEGYYFRAGPGGWIDAGPAQLDRVIAEAGRRGVRLIVTLSNSWSDYGGVPQYLRWSGRWRPDTFGAADGFYSDPAARAAFRAHVERLLGRTNTVTGIRYRDDPTILAWELMNESRVDTAAGARARRAWVVEMARLVHRLDPRHLVTSGVTGYRLERERAEWLALCALPEVDYCDGHFYPEEMLGERDTEMLDAFIDDFAQLALHVAGKPFVLGEFGVRGDGRGLWRGETRAAWTARIFERLRLDGASGGLIWIYQSTPGGPESHAISVGEPVSAPLRAAMRAAADAVALPAPGAVAATNPLLGPERGSTPIFPLRADITGPTAAVPTWPASSPPSPSSSSSPSRSSPRLTWDPLTFSRASWEASGAYAGGVLAHVWGTETGFFEYDYEVAPAAPSDTPSRPSSRVWIRARLSSEYPGTISPPDGMSAFEVSIDGVLVGRALAARDDGMGRAVMVASRRPEVVSAATAPGPHHLRFTVPAGPRAHGLCLYGEPGAKPKAGLAGARVELGW